MAQRDEGHEGLDSESRAALAALAVQWRARNQLERYVRVVCHIDLGTDTVEERWQR